jgi:hypothetical protein
MQKVWTTLAAFKIFLKKSDYGGNTYTNAVKSPFNISMMDNEYERFSVITTES